MPGDDELGAGDIYGVDFPAVHVQVLADVAFGVQAV
jgi:hypothetical protein